MKGNHSEIQARGAREIFLLCGFGAGLVRVFDWDFGCVSLVRFFFVLWVFLIVWVLMV